MKLDRKQYMAISLMSMFGFRLGVVSYEGYLFLERIAFSVLIIGLTYISASILEDKD